MIRRVGTTAAAAICIILAGCTKKAELVVPDRQSAIPVPIVVTADIQAGIEHHIEEQANQGGGYYHLRFKDRDLRLKLVRVHTEYLANLGPRRHFACVDLADTDGEVYDVDFFLAGDPGAMQVTETTVHKVNGQPEYVWEQHTDKTWHRVPADGAPERLLGVISGRDEFDFEYRATLPEIREAARMWLPLPASDAYQTVETLAMPSVGEREILEEKKHGNRVLFLKLTPEDSGKVVAIIYHVRRLEKPVHAETDTDPRSYLEPERLVPINEDFRTIADEVLNGKKGDLVRARALFDHVIERMRT